MAGLAGAVGSPLRMELRRSPAGLVVLNDSYNANPTSMAAAARCAGRLSAPGRRFAVLGQMAELGPHAAAEHHRLGELVAAAGVETAGGGGGPPQPGRPRRHVARARRAGRRSAGDGVEAVVVGGPEAAVAALTDRLRPGDAVLVKASRVVGLEQVAAALLDWSRPVRSATRSLVIALLLAAATALILSLAGTPFLIRVLRARSIGQQIRDDGPERPRTTKAGTPTMGGIAIVVVGAGRLHRRRTCAPAARASSAAAWRSWP